MREPAWDGVEHDFRARESVGDAGEKLPYSLRLEIHQQSLGDDEHAGRGIDRVHPYRVERARGDVAETRGRREKALPQTDRIGQVHGQPMHPSVIDASALRFEAFSEGNDTPIRMVLKPRPQRP